MKKQALAILPLFFAVSVFANETACPSAEAIKSVGINTLYMQEDNTWQAAYLPDNTYNTDSHWRFALGSRSEAKDKSDAMKKATAALDSLHFAMGPIDDGKAVACYYMTNDSMINGIAVTPPDAM